jgi:solute:Na+ symporter, SSS family
VTLATPPIDQPTLVRFYRLVRPAGPGWAPVQRDAGGVGSPDSLPMALLGWVMGCAFVYSALFGAGSFLYGRIPQGLVFLGVALASGWGLWKLLPALWSGAGRAA